MIKILHVIDSLDLGGAQTVLLNFARFRDRERFALTVAAMHGRGIFARPLEREGIPVVSLSARGFPPGYLLTLPRLLGKEHFDVVHFHLFGSNWIAKPLAAACGVRLRINHDHCNDRVRAECWWRRSLDGVTNRLSSHIFAVSGSTRDCLVGEEGIHPAKVSILPNAVDTGRFRPAGEAERVKARENLGVSGSRSVVVGLGRLHPQKNWPIFLQVAARFPEVDFVIAGMGPEEERLRQLAPGHVRFVGFRDSREVLAAADVFLLTSDYEGTPMTLLEAMACGVPSVVSAVDGCEEIMGGGIGGVTAVPGDVEDFARKLETFLADGNRRSTQGAAARERALGDFDARQQTRAVEAVYEKLLAGR
jgi:glycosyltransferase involved in cell wall biosynthesis